MEMDMTTWLNFTKRSDGIITHYAPNTNESYHYGHTQTAKSDIMTWKPTGGTFVDVNVYTWLNLKYPFESQINMVSPNYSPLSTGILDYRSDISNCNGDPNDKLGATTEIKYHVFWWQCMPGYNAKVNWWDVFYNWDNAKKNKTKLY
jgi:hypothetical protein